MFKDYNEVRQPLELPINGKTYTIPPVMLDDGIRLTDGLDPKSATVLTDDEFYRIVLGPAWDEMKADYVTPSAIYLAGLTALADWKTSRAAAEVLWAAGGDPKAMRAPANRAQRRSTSKSTGAAPTTPKVASGTTTTSRKTSNGSKSK
jgi:hypothetical protein